MKFLGPSPGRYRLSFVEGGTSTKEALKYGNLSTTQDFLMQ